MTAGIHQPNFIPWTGYFNKINSCDIFVLFDDVQFPRAKNYGNRVLIKTNNGTAWITVPVSDKGDLNNFNEARIDNSHNWVAKSAKTIKLAYQKSAHFKDNWAEFEAIYTTKYDLLFDLNFALMNFVCRRLGITTVLVRSSDIPEARELNGEEKIIAILKHVKATTYISGKGAGSQRYIDQNDFQQNGIELVWQNFVAQPYRQLWGTFVPNLSIIDLLFNEGAEGIKFIS